MKSGELICLIDKHKPTSRFLGTVTLALATLVGSAATNPAVAEIILHTPEVSAGADTRATRSVMGEIVATDSDQDTRSDAGTVGASASVSGASATAGASISATVTSNPAAGTVEIIAAGSTSLSASRNAPTQSGTSFSTASGSANFFQVFDLTDRPYEYLIAAETEVSVSGTPAGSRASARVLLGSHFDQRINERGFLFSDGSASGVLPPGQHAISATAGGSYDIGQADATFALSFELTAASRWIDSAGGTFRVADNWDFSIVPGANDVAVFDLPGTYTVSLDQDVTTKRLRTNGAGVNVAFDLQGSTYEVDEMIIGGQPGDEVSISFGDSAGPVSSPPIGAAAAAPQPSRVQVLAKELLTVGEGGTATADVHYSTPKVNVKNGGKVNVRTGNGRLTVTDTLTLGESGIGELEVSSGGHLITGDADLGSGAGTSTARVENIGSSWETSELLVGIKSDAALIIRDKGAVAANRCIIGFQATGRIEVNNGIFTHTGSEALIVGIGAQGVLEIRNGGVVEVNSLTIAALPSATGTVLVESNGELRVTNGSLLVSKEFFDVPGADGIGKLTINGGRVDRTSIGSLDETSISPRSTLEILNGHFHDSQQLTVNGTLALKTGLGSASVGNSRIQSAGRLTVGPDGTLDGSGLIRGDVRVLGRVIGGLDQFDGRVRPGTSPGTLTVEGNYEQTSGILEIEIGGTARGEFDVLAITGNALLGGELVLKFIGGFSPRQGDSFEFLDVDGALEGTFSAIAIGNLEPGFEFDISSDGGRLTMVALNDGIFVPEPSTYAMLCAGMLTILFRQRVRRTVSRQ